MQDQMTEISNFFLGLMKKDGFHFYDKEQQVPIKCGECERQHETILETEGNRYSRCNFCFEQRINAKKKEELERKRRILRIEFEKISNVNLTEIEKRGRLDHPILTQILENYESYTNGFVLYGKHGHGKTVCACMVAVNRTHKRLKRALYIRSSDLQDKQDLSDLFNCYTLIIDELGRSDSSTDYQMNNTRDKLSKIIDKRVYKKKYTIFITNMSIHNPIDFKGLIDESRINLFKQIHFEYKDLRGLNNG